MTSDDSSALVESLQRTALLIRRDIIRMTMAAGSGHPWREPFGRGSGYRTRLSRAEDRSATPESGRSGSIDTVQGPRRAGALCRASAPRVPPGRGAALVAAVWQPTPRPCGPEQASRNRGGDRMPRSGDWDRGRDGVGQPPRPSREPRVHHHRRWRVSIRPDVWRP